MEQKKSDLSPPATHHDNLLPHHASKKLNIMDIEASLTEILLELAPGFIHDLNNMMGIVDNYRDIHRIAYSDSIPSRNLSKIFDKVIGTSLNTRNLLSILRKNTNKASVTFNESLTTIVNLFQYKFIEKKIVFDTSIDTLSCSNLPFQFVNYLMITIMFYIIEVTCDQGTIRLSIETTDNDTNLIVKRKSINPVPNDVEHKNNSTIAFINKHMENCNRYLDCLGVKPIEMLTEKNDVKSQIYVLKLSLPEKYFDIPAKRTAPIRSNKTDKKDMKQKKIMIIDDEAIMCDLLISVFEEYNYKLDHSTDYEDSLKKLKKTKFDIVICDYILPGATAKQVVDNIRKCSKKTKIIIITGCEEQVIEQELLQPPVHAFLRKPFKIDDIVGIVTELI